MGDFGLALEMAERSAEVALAEGDEAGDPIGENGDVAVSDGDIPRNVASGFGVALEIIAGGDPGGHAVELALSDVPPREVAVELFQGLARHFLFRQGADAAFDLFQQRRAGSFVVCRQ